MAENSLDAPPSSRRARTLRAEMEARRDAATPYTLKEALGIVVSLCTELTELHTSGHRLFFHPSALLRAGDRVMLDPELSERPPSEPRDVAILAPEQGGSEPGDARASVFAVGALLYEILTEASVGPGMVHPSELRPDLPKRLTSILGKALIADPAQRPSDLAALAAALHGIAPGASIPPPKASSGALDDDGTDVSMSMLPPPPAPGAAPPPRPVRGAAQGQPPAGAGPRLPVDPTARLAQLKAALETDPRPRFVVAKDGMDHGPFNAVELLQQIATGSFVAGHTLRDDFTRVEKPIGAWDQFAPFAEQASLNREIVAEKRALDAVVAKEKTGTRIQGLLAAALLGLAVAAGVVYFVKVKGTRNDRVGVQADNAQFVDVDAGYAGSKGSSASPGGGGRPSSGTGSAPAGGGNYPSIANAGSCEAAQARYVEEYKLSGNDGPPDLTAGAYGAVLNKGSYLNACGVPSNMAVNVCAAVQNGHAVGVTVRTEPPNPGIQGCIAGAVRALPFPSHPRLDVARTAFAAE